MSGFLIDDRGRHHEIAPDRPFRIGREPGCDIVIPEDSVSREHASISASGNRFLLRDFSSSNGTFVNGHRIAADPVLLSDGDSIRFGRIRFGFAANQLSPSGSIAQSAGPRSIHCRADATPVVLRELESPTLQPWGFLLGIPGRFPRSLHLSRP